MSGVWRRLRSAPTRLFKDTRGLAATEFAFIVPFMLVMFFGTVEISSGVAVDRKVTLVARTLSDLLSQAGPPPPPAPVSSYAPADDTYLQNVFTAGIAILTPYCAVPATLQLTEIYVDSNQVAKVQWSKAASVPTCNATQVTLTNSTRSAGDTITIPPTLLVKQTYLIFSEVSYNYTPVGIGYVMKSNVILSDVSYTRPRQVVCVIYNNLPVALPSPPGSPANPCPAT
ncbi:MAG TPA: TadE/TadG family type IV pilus assembly protein [Bradyrhizobium sp.]